VSQPPPIGDPVPPVVPLPWVTDDLQTDVRRRLLDRRIVVVSGSLDGATATDVTAELMLLDATDDAPIDLRVSCPDGELDACLALADTIDLLGVEVHARCTGRLGGAALVPFVAATRRTATRHSVVVLREPEARFEVHARDVEAVARVHAERVTAMWERLALATGRTVDVIAADARRGLVLSADEARRFGLVDDVV
jgi:ATP-dependent Clp protease protease subunit